MPLHSLSFSPRKTVRPSFPIYPSLNTVKYCAESRDDLGKEIEKTLTICPICWHLHFHSNCSPPDQKLFPPTPTKSPQYSLSFYDLLCESGIGLVTERVFIARRGFSSPLPWILPPKTILTFFTNLFPYNTIPDPKQFPHTPTKSPRYFFSFYKLLWEIANGSVIYSHQNSFRIPHKTMGLHFSFSIQTRTIPILPRKRYVSFSASIPPPKTVPTCPFLIS